jgi:hypothetical protein
MFSITKNIQGKDCSIVLDYYCNAVFLIDKVIIARADTAGANDYWFTIMREQGFKRSVAGHYTRIQFGTFKGSPKFTSNYYFCQESKMTTAYILKKRTTHKNGTKTNTFNHPAAIERFFADYINR